MEVKESSCHKGLWNRVLAKGWLQSRAVRCPTSPWQVNLRKYQENEWGCCKQSRLRHSQELLNKSRNFLNAKIKKRIYYQLPRGDAGVFLLALFKSRWVRASERHTKGNIQWDQMTRATWLNKSFLACPFWHEDESHSESPRAPQTRITLVKLFRLIANGPWFMGIG